MKKPLKIIAVFLVLALSTGIMAACDGGSSNNSPGTSSPPSQSGTQPSDTGHFARDPYTISYVYGNAAPINIGFIAALEAFGAKMNFKVKATGADFDPAKVLEIIQTDIDVGVDGFLINVMSETYPRQHEMLMEAGIPYINLMGPYIDDQGRNMSPAVAFDGYKAGKELTEWWIANFPNFLDGADMADIGYMVVTFTVAFEFTDRSNGAIDTYLAMHPELRDNLFVVDLINFGIDIAYDQVAATIAANADVGYWVIYAVAEDFAVGANRAIESLNRVDSTMVLCTGNDIAFEEWDKGATPQWVALIPVWKTSMMGTAAEGILALIDGSETAETLWASRRAPGDLATLFYVESEVVTRDTYKDFIARTDAAFGIS